MSTKKRTYRGQSSEARRAERRHRLLDAGFQMFGENGFHATSVKQLCQTAGLTERYFYESFKNREELFAACYDHKLDDLLQAILQSLQPLDRPPIELAEMGLSCFFQALKQDPQMARILLIEIYGTQYDLQRLYQRSIGRFSMLVQNIALKQLPRPSNRSFDMELLATGLVGVCIQMAQRWAIEGYQQPPERLVMNCMLIFGGLGDRLAAG